MFTNTFSEEIYENSYKHSSDETWENFIERLVRHLPEEIQKETYEKIKEMKFIPGGRILSNLGLDDYKKTTLMNCFVNDNDGNMDSIEGIYDALKKQAKTLASEGGYGTNFSKIRPAGTLIKGTGIRTPGVIAFMQLWDKSSEIVTRGYYESRDGRDTSNEKKKIRKGAQMGVLSCWHPDIREFISAKQKPGQLTKFNISVGITEGFMEAVEKDLDWELKYPDTTFEKYDEEWDGNIKKWENAGYPIIVYETIKAKNLWEDIMLKTYQRNEPGVLFLDLANKLNPLAYNEEIYASNPCVVGETVVAVADGRGDKTIKELAESGKDVPVYCSDNDGRLAIRMMRNPRITGDNEDIYEVTLEDGHKIRATPNHKFMITSGEYRELKDLKIGDGLKIMKKLEASIKDVFQTENSNSQDYIWCKYNSNTLQAEHRLVYEFDTNTSIQKGYVIHHANFNAKNNHISNLQCMTKEDHDRLHGDSVRGENNPMIKWYQNASDEEKQRYHDNMSASTSKEKNGRYSGYTNDELYSHAIKLTKSVGRLFTKDMWIEYAKEHGLPQHFSKWRLNHLGGISGLAKKAAKELNLLPEVVTSAKVLQVYYDALDQGYDAEVINNNVYVNKICETCGTAFKAPYQRREYGICSSKCGFRNYVNHRHNDIKRKQIEIFNRLKFENKSEPKKADWIINCKLDSVSPEISRKSSPFKSWNELKEAAASFNHRIVNIKYIGKDVVYNGTVDDYHNFFIGGFEDTSKYNKRESNYYNNLQCGEILMSTGVCNLGSINLTQFVEIKENKPIFNFKEFQDTVKLGVYYLDTINDISPVPLPEYKKAMIEKRRIGLGIMGLGSTLFMLNMKYGGEESLKFVNKLYKLKAETELLTSSYLGSELGSFPLFNKKKYFSSYWWKNLDISREIKKTIEENGEMRNSHRSMNAPTGQTSIFANNVSGGIEPVFAKEYYRFSIVTGEELINFKNKYKIPDIHNGEWFETDVFKFKTAGDEEILEGEIEHIIYQIDKNRGLIKRTLIEDYGWKFVKENGFENLYVHKTAQELSVKDHLSILKIASKWTDQNNSKTINLPEDYSFDDFKNVYQEAYNSNIKGLTTYREGTMTAVLQKKEEYQNSLDELFDKSKDKIIPDNIKLPNEYFSKGFIIKDKNKKKWYINLAFADSKYKRPFAIFINSNHRESSEIADGLIEKMETLCRSEGIKEELINLQKEKYMGQSNVVKIARGIGMALRHNIKLTKILNILEEYTEEISSLIYFIGKILSKYVPNNTLVEKEMCPICNKETIIYMEGCKSCKSCGWSKC